jgi:hypothetical protein
VSDRPAPTRRDHQTFCEVEGWQRVRNARRKSGHHVTYELTLPDGRVLRTRVSHPPDRQTYGPSMWSHILRDQLAVSEDEFWACVRDGSPPDRGGSGGRAEGLPLDLVHLLVTRVGVPESEVLEMTKDEAVQRLNDFWAQS